MRKLSMLFAAAAMAAPFPAQANPVQHPPSSGANAQTIEFCNELVASGDYPTLNYGECISFNKVPEQANPKICDMLRETGELEDYGFSSYSDCVRYFVY